MNEPKWTPGPWEIRVLEDEYVIRSGSYCIGAAWNINEEPENLANALLISAGPDLVNALEASRIYVADAVARDGGIDNCQIEYRMDLELIDAALSKAKGPTT